MNLWIIIGILFLHWIFDFVFQKDEDARNKCNSMKHLLSHTKTYSLCWFIPICIYGAIVGSGMKILLFIPITFLFHTITDYYTSRLNRKLYDQAKIHEFFVGIGFDQWLHYLQLLLTFYILTK